MLRQFHLSLLIIILLSNTIHAQKNEHRNNNFTSPVDIPVFLSGTFGELRSNHFHSGIDIKTQGSEGKLIKSIGNGWITRIKVSTSGYGKAIYVTHPDGYVSVYGHLQRFNDTIQSVVIADQYENESFITQLFFEKDEWLVSKGEIIAYSGNTGGSHGPHLHFEIRDEKTQHPLNPLMFNFIKVKDFYRPKITKLAVYPIDSYSTINGINDTCFYDLSGWGLGHKIKGDSIIKISGRVAFGISSYDLMNGVSNKNGVANTKMYLDTSLVYDLDINRLSFNTTRFINSLIDYSYYKKSKHRIVRTQIDTNNLLNNYNIVLNNGIITLTDTLPHNVSYEVRDIHENLSKLTFTIVTDTVKSNISLNKSTAKGNQNKFKYSKSNKIVQDSINAHFTANSFYNSFLFNYKEIECDSCKYSKIFKLHNQYTPVHKYYTLNIVTRLIPDSLLEKIFIAYSPDNKDYTYINSSMDKNSIKAKPRNLGYFRVMSDTNSPEVSFVNFNDEKSISKQSKLMVKISDNETGIKSYRATLNGSWILMEYDPKKNLLTYNIDDKTIPGKNSFQIVVEDMVGNIKDSNCTLFY
jgi:peptidase M23-like protein